MRDVVIEPSLGRLGFGFAFFPEFFGGAGAENDAYYDEDEAEQVTACDDFAQEDGRACQGEKCVHVHEDGGFGGADLSD